jgi:hypothetical protein
MRRFQPDEIKATKILFDRLGKQDLQDQLDFLFSRFLLATVTKSLKLNQPVNQSTSKLINEV